VDYVFLLIAVTFAFSLGLGFLLEKYLRMPWMFSALFLGIIFSSFGLFQGTLQDETFNVLSTMGMLFLLFMIGFNLEIGQMKRFGKQILKGAILIVTLEATIVGTLLFFLFPTQVGNSPLVAIVVALSFATVGEAVLLPILAKFSLLRTKFGQLTLGIGTLDDVLEVLTLIMIPFLPIFLPTLHIQGFPNPTFVVLDLIGIFILTLILVKIASKIKHVLSNNVNFGFIRPLIIMLIFFSFVVVGRYQRHFRGHRRPKLVAYRKLPKRRKSRKLLRVHCLVAHVLPKRGRKHVFRLNSCLPHPHSGYIGLYTRRKAVWRVLAVSEDVGKKTIAASGFGT
jgi:Kef-type K+ transport system membrane component KefB